MSLKYEQYIKDADVDAVTKCVEAIRPLYDLYTPADIAEAHYQIRKELDMIVEREEKRKRIKKLQQDLESDWNLHFFNA